MSQHLSPEQTIGAPQDWHFESLLRLADTSLILGHRLSEWTGKAPTLEEELAMANVALDLVGQSRALYTRAGEIEGKGRTEDQLAYLRDTHDFRNLLIVEKENGDYAVTIARQVLYSAFAMPFYEALTGSADDVLAGIAAKAVKEYTYHLRHGSEWLVRFGDGTEESHERAQDALDTLWMYTGEMFEMDAVDQAALATGVGVDRAALKSQWDATINEVLAMATLKRPADGWMISGSRTGTHTEHLGHILAQMQFLQRAYPGQSW
ncbi:MAG: 1,2-phenylacetyl-CoA epoxidase subunit PaaC [Pseudomonadota bacterium]